MIRPWPWGKRKTQIVYPSVQAISNLLLATRCGRNNSENAVRNLYCIRDMHHIGPCAPIEDDMSTEPNRESDVYKLNRSQFEQVCVWLRSQRAQVSGDAGLIKWHGVEVQYSFNDVCSEVSVKLIDHPFYISPNTIWSHIDNWFTNIAC